MAFVEIGLVVKLVAATRALVAPAKLRPEFADTGVEVIMPAVPTSPTCKQTRERQDAAVELDCCL